uniref:Uncharacterized protein n=1 Tax=Brassica oleracea TaxID=3712 RepID=A0A3P6FDE5_BRAOL|nr:unnamed protein product [Brassica oleracea]
MRLLYTFIDRYLKREKREKREKVDLSVGFDVRPARERACRRRSPLSFSINCPVFVSSPSPPASALSKFWPTTTRGVSVLGVNTRLLGGYGVVKTLVVWVLIPEMEASTDSAARRILFPWRW